MNVKNSYEIDENHFNDRMCIRKNVAIDAFIRPIGGSKTLVKILDVSETGFRMQSPSRFDMDKDIFITIPGLQSLEANMVWNRNETYGCTFLVPLHPAILEHISKVFADQEDEHKSL